MSAGNSAGCKIVGGIDRRYSRNLKRLFIVDPFGSKLCVRVVMKRLTPILFLLLYTFTVLVGSTVGRAQAWAAEHSRDSKRHAPQYLARISEWHRRAPRQMFQTKILEDGSFVVPPFVRHNPTHSEAVLQHVSAGFIAGHRAKISSTRAPPATIS